MSRNKYHHGNLKHQLIDNGLLLLNEEGIKGFSLRKVAKMCDVSHSAPYKHFKDKNALINEIAKEVWKKFHLAVSQVTSVFQNNPKLLVIELGKTYIKFMIENPEYLKFMFLSDGKFSVNIGDGKFDVEDAAFELFKDSSEKYLKEINLDEKLHQQKILAMWSLIHGLTILIAQKSIKYNGNYLDLVEEIIKNNI